MKVITENDKQLTTTEQTIYTKIVKYNKENKSINKTISKLLETGKNGINSVVNISIKLKIANESLQAVKQSVYRFYKDKPKNQRLSLQGLGKKDKAPFMAVPSNSGGISKKPKAIKKVSSDIVKAYMTKLLKDDESQYNELTYDFVLDMSAVEKRALVYFLTETLKKAM